MSKPKSPSNSLSKQFKFKIQDSKLEKEDKYNDNDEYNFLLNKLDDEYLLDDIIEEKLEIENSHENFENFKPKIKEKPNEVLLKNINRRKDSDIKKKKLEEFLNLNNENNPNELPKVGQTNLEQNDNIELNKIKSGKSSKYYQRLENNYIRNNQEIRDLRQDNNLLRFQLEDLSRKINKVNSNQQNNSNLQKKLEKMKMEKKNNLAKLYGTNISNNSRGTKNSFFDSENNKNEKFFKQIII